MKQWDGGKKGHFHSALGLASPLLRRPGKRAMFKTEPALKSRAFIVLSWLPH